MDKTRLGRRIKAFRKLKGYTQVGLAEKLNISVMCLGNVERGEKPITNDLLKQIANQLSISKQELMNAASGEEKNE